MKLYLVRRLIAFGTLMVFLSVTFACRIIPTAILPGHEYQISLNDGYYEFDPVTILSALKDGKTDLFTLQAEPAEINHPLASTNPVEWDQTDYLQIAAVFSEYVQDPVQDGWNLHMMLLRMDCNDASHGPQQAFFEYFKVDHEQGEKRRYVQGITIKPLENSIMWTMGKYYHVTNNWDSIDLSKQKISAQAAFNIAEDNGGLEVRSNVKNECTIFITLSPDGSYDGWEVGYTAGDPHGLLNVYVNEITGDYELEYPPGK